MARNLFIYVVNFLAMVHWFLIGGSKSEYYIRGESNNAIISVF